MNTKLANRLSVLAVVAGMILSACAQATPTAIQPTTVQPTAVQPTAAQPTAAQPTAAQPTAAQPTAAQPTAAQPTAAQAVNLNLWTWTTPTTHDFVTKQIAAFEAQHPNVKITYTEFPSAGAGAYEDKLLTALSTGTAADVFFITDSATPRYASKAQILPIDDAALKAMGYGSMDGLAKDLHYLPGALDGWSNGGKDYALPQEESWLYLVADTDCMKDSGIDPNTVEFKTWDDVISVGAKMSRFDTKGNFTRKGFELPSFGDDTWNMLVTTIFLTQSGGSVLSPDGKEAWINKPEAVAGFKQMLAIETSKAANPNFGAPGVDGVWTGFFTDKSVCMSTWGPWAYNAGIKGAALDGKWKAYSMPQMTAGKGPGNVYWGWGWVVNAKTNYPTESWQLVQALGSAHEENCSAIGNWLPLDNLAQSPCVTSNPEYKVIIDTPKLTNPQFIFKSTNYAEIARIVRKYYELMVFDKLDVQQGLDSAAKEINDAVKS